VRRGVNDGRTSRDVRPGRGTAGALVTASASVRSSMPGRRIHVVGHGTTGRRSGPTPSRTSAIASVADAGTRIHGERDLLHLIERQRGDRDELIIVASGR
jgi:hypothetical protein